MLPSEEGLVAKIALGSRQQVTERFSLYVDPHPEVLASFADDVRSGLGAADKTLPPKYFYDDLGSALFEAITKLPEYYLTRIERTLLSEYSDEIAAAVGEAVELVELGSGSAQKTRHVIDALLARQGQLTYHAIDISSDALISSAHALTEARADLTVMGYASDYFSLLRDGGPHTSARVLALFLGSNLGNYAPREANRLLRSLAGNLKPGDALLIGTDLKKDASVLELAYDDPTGVTAAFNKNIIARINRELGGEFDVRAFDHVVKYDEKRGAVDSFLASRRKQKVPIRALGMEVAFERGERIHTESSYKFDRADIARIARKTGYAVARMWTDPMERYGLTLLSVA